MAQEEGLRARKKRQTRAAIEKAALDLVDKRGFDAVTVDDICAAADISRMTFFNYFPTKIAAVMGQHIDTLTSDELLEELETHKDTNYLDVLTDALSMHIFPAEDRAIQKRRREVLSRNDGLLFHNHKNFDTAHRAVSESIASYLEAHPERRLFPERSLEEEANTAAVTVTYLTRMRMMFAIHEGTIAPTRNIRKMLVHYLDD